MAADAIWTPSGVVPLNGGKKLDRVELRPAMIEWFRQFSDFAAHHQIGIHCARCGGDFTGRNADTDATFSSACGCREFIGQNREYLNRRSNRV